MAKATPDQLARLEADIEHLREEIATIELTSAHAQGPGLQHLLAGQRELRDTLDSKQRHLRALQPEGGVWE